MERFLEDPATKGLTFVGQDGVGINLHTALAVYRSGKPIENQSLWQNVAKRLRNE
jgi:hypothetical protein